jgi:O-antigen/teichoic acid export membrane protein
VILFGSFNLFIGNVFEVIFRNSEFLLAEHVLSLLISSYFLMGVGEMWGTVCRLNHSSRFAPKVMGAAVCSNLLFNFLLIPKYMLLGAALATFLSELISQTIFAYYAINFSKPYRLFITGTNVLMCISFLVVTIISSFYPKMPLEIKGLLLFTLIAAILFLLHRTHLLYLGMPKVQREEGAKELMEHPN